MKFRLRNSLIYFISFVLLGIGVYYFYGIKKKSPQPTLQGPFLSQNQLPTEQEKQILLRMLRAGLDSCGEKPSPFSYPEGLGRLAAYRNPLQIAVWNKGKRVFRGTFGQSTFETALFRTLRDLCSAKGIKKLSPQERQDAQFTIALGYDLQPFNVQTYSAQADPLGKKIGLFGTWEAQKKRWRFAEWFVRKNIGSDRLLRTVCGKPRAGKRWKPSECLGPLEGQIYWYYVQQFIETPMQVPQELFRLSPFVSFEDLSRDQLEKRAHWAAEWFEKNTDSEGRIAYLYLPARNDYSDKGEIFIRQWMGTWALQRLAAFFKTPALVAAARRNLNHNLKLTLQTDSVKNISYVLHNGQAEIGSVAGLLMSLLTSPEPSSDRKLIDRLVRFLLGQMEESGKFKTYLIPSGKDHNQAYYPGEAILALMMAYEKFPKKFPQIPEKVELAFGYYREFFRKNPETAFVPWHTQSLFKLYRIRPKPEVAEFIFEMNDFLVKRRRVSANYSQLKKLSEEKRLYDPKAIRPQAGISEAAFLEGMVYALQLARQLNDQARLKLYRETSRLWLRNIFQLQYTPENIFYLPDREAVLGGVILSETNRLIRIDNVQHAAAAYLNFLENPRTMELIFAPDS